MAGLGTDEGGHLSVRPALARQVQPVGAVTLGTLAAIMCIDVVDIVDIYLAGILVLALPRVHPLPAEHLIRGAALPAAK